MSATVELVVRAARVLILVLLAALAVYGLARILTTPDPAPALGMVTAASIAGVVAMTRD
jgi:hypothetical protein